MSSAAEKLRGAAPWDQWREYLNADLMDLIEGDDMERVLNALPQIVAMVEDAEFISDYHEAHGNESREAAWLMNLREALAALDEALS